MPSTLRRIRQRATYHKFAELLRVARAAVEANDATALLEFLYCEINDRNAYRSQRNANAAAESMRQVLTDMGVGLPIANRGAAMLAAISRPESSAVQMDQDLGGGETAPVELEDVYREINDDEDEDDDIVPDAVDPDEEQDDAVPATLQFRPTIHRGYPTPTSIAPPASPGVMSNNPSRFPRRRRR